MHWDIKVQCSLHLGTTLSLSRIIFDNRYAGDERAQILNAKAADLTTQDFQNLDGQFEIIHFCPIAQELDFDMIQNVEEGALTIATPQGWLRKWDRDGKVTFQNLDWQNLKGIDFVIISEEDVPELERRLSEIRKYIDKLIVTKGGSGATIYFGDEVLDFPAFTTKVVDPTGAGDSFATGFITRYAQTKDLRESMIYANCLSSLCIENVGTLFFDRIDEVDNRIYEYKRRYTTI